MNVTEFKEKYPEYADLEGEALWDMMEEVLIASSETLRADPDREVFYHDPVTIPMLQDDGTYKDFTIQIEDSSKTRWLNSKGEVVKLKEEKSTFPPTTSCRMEIWDASEPHDDKLPISGKIYKDDGE